MLSCWNHDPLKRPSFRKLVERTELLLSENTKNVSRWKDDILFLKIICWYFCEELENDGADTDRKLREQEMSFMCNKGPQLDSNHGC